MFKVLWLPPAETYLIQLWVSSPDKAAITAAANRIDELLTSDPLGQGESRENNNRIVFEGPLAVLYDVNEQDRLVHVKSVIRSGKKPE